MKKITVLMEKFCDLNPSLGTTSAFYNIVGSLNSSGIVESQVFHYDEYLFNTGTPIDDYLLEYLCANKPDYLFTCYYPFEDPRNVKLETFQRIRDLGIPVIFIWFDFCHEHIRNLAIKVNSVASLSVVVDTFDVPEGFLPMWVPQDENIFKLGNCPKDINLSFVGTTNGYGTRITYLDYLKNNIPIHISGGQREHRLTIEQYAKELKRSKITLNFPDKPDGVIQAKCRIYESMLCGTLLMEKDNEAIKHWFEPMVHYVPFTTEQDLLSKINYYLQNTKERESIINNATEKMTNDYSSKNWWVKVFSKAS